METPIKFLEEKNIQEFWYDPCSEQSINLSKVLEEYAKIEITRFLDFLLKEGYCDSDVYSEPPTAIDQYYEKKRKNPTP
jgi:hypothetical protein